jgi:hypothetical protein
MYVVLGKDAKTVGEFALDLEAHGGCGENVTNVTVICV